MANLISHNSKNISFSINNSWTSVLYSTLLISGSETANSQWEKYFMIWLAEHDQGIVGQGMVGIDFDDIYWSEDDFENQQSFVVNIAKNAIEKQLWRNLDYQTDEDTLTELLNNWIDLFQQASKDDINTIDDFKWYVKPGLDDLDRKCAVHGIFLNKLGETEKACCYLCDEI